VTTAVNAGMKSLEHLVGLEREFSLLADSIRREETTLIKNFTSPNGLQLLASIRRKRFAATSGSFDERKANEICALLKSKNVYVTPTLIVLVRMARRDDLAAQKAGVDQFVDSQTKTDWNSQWERLLKDTAFASSEKRAQSLLKMTNTLYRNNVMLLAGTDCPNSWVVAGYSLHREFEYLNEAGIANADILRMATINPARFMNKEKETGSVATGKFADLVILNGNPLDEILNTQKIDGVILKGKWFSQADLEALKKSALLEQ
jgi:imidazolonepropionase-like amidohydrolase